MISYTPEGCRLAIEYLKRINKYSLVQREDGYTIVSYANYWMNNETSRLCNSR